MPNLPARRRNPFTATVGKTPPVVVGRDSFIEDFHGALFDGPGSHERISIVTGPRGAGKTVLLNELEDAAKSQGWFVISETTTTGFNERIRDALLQIAVDHFDTPRTRISGVFGPFNTGVTTEQISLHQPTPTLRSALDSVFALQGERSAKLRGETAGVLVTLDELHYAHMQEIIEFGTTVQHMVRENRDLAVVMAGIPGAVKPLLAADEGRNPVTFLRRANRMEVGMVTLQEAMRALEEPITDIGMEWEPEALHIASQATGGYPFMIQLVGQYAFRKSTGDVIDMAAVQSGLVDARRRLGELVHEPSLADLSEVDRTFLIAMAQDDGPAKIADIAARMGVDSQYAGNYRRRLIDAEMIRPTAHGYVDFELPYMREYLRAHPASDALEQFTLWPESGA